MKYELVISPQNEKPHTDIEHDIEAKKNGLFTFTLRVNGGKIVDYNVIEYVDARKYISLSKVIVEEYIISRNS